MEQRKNANLLLILTIFLATTVFCTPALGRVIYVDDDAGGTNNGSDWTNAYRDLQDALAEAGIAGEPVEIRVARGVYQPDRGGGIILGDRNATFQLINDVAIYGGYAGAGEPDPDARDIKFYKSILSGDLNGDDVEVDELSRLLNESTRRDNSFHVVTGSHTDQTAVLDGFVITAGSGAGGESRGGAGMLIESGSPAIIDCLFTGNAAFGRAAALMNMSGSEPMLIGCTFDWNDSLHGAVENAESNPVFSDCKFSRNSFAGMFNDNQSDPILINCIFADNRQQGMHNRGSSNPNLTDCTFKNNGWQGMENWNSSPILTDCTFDTNKREGLSNRSDSLPVLTGCTFTGHSNCAIDHHGIGTMILRDCLFSDNTGSSGAAINSFSDVILYGCTFIRNSARSRGGAITVSGPGSLTLNGCTFSGNSASDGGAIRTSGNMVLRNCLFDGNSARYGGAIVSWGDLTRIYNCTFSGNRSDIEGSCVRQIRPGGLSLSHCILWDNGQEPISGEAEVSYSDIEGGFPGPGNIDIDPLFAQPGAWDPNGTPEDNSDDFWIGGDYHLLSQAGRWDSNSRSWVQDNATSPCIDAGDPNSPLGPEPFPNGARVNMGAYGATDKAGKSYFGGPTCDVILPGDINGDCVVDFEDLSIVVSHWMMRGEDFVNKPPTIRLIEPQDGAQITWPGPTMFRAEAQDPDGRIVSVRFVLQQIRDNGSSGIGLGTVNEEGNVWQREYTWQDNARSGDWDVWAEATDNENAVSISEKITITLNR